MACDKQFDIVIYGATGFTGRLVAQYFTQQCAGDTNVNWAMAGRSPEKLARIRDEIGAPGDTPLIVANADDPASLRKMVKQSKVVLTTVGPYQLYGNELVALCAELGSDYVDLCGEPAWMYEMIEQHQDTAKASGARIVFSCGFDSIPFDLGVYFLQQHAKQQFGGPFNRVKGRVRSMKGTFSGGTAASLKATMMAAKSDPEVYKRLLNPFSLTPGFTGPTQPHGNKSVFEEEFNSWSAPFIMAAINTRNVHRSNMLLDFQYGKDFVYDEMMLTGPGDRGEATANAVANDKSMSGENAPKPGEGPSKEEREAGFFDLLFYASNDKGQHVSVSVKGDMDPGYGCTAKMIAQSALCLLQDNVTTQGGIWTTAPALGTKLIQRLQQSAGMTFEIE